MPDVTIENHGLYVFRPLTDAAREWIADNVSSESWQWLGSALCVEDRRNAMDIAQGMLSDGLIVE